MRPYKDTRPRSPSTISQCGGATQPPPVVAGALAAPACSGAPCETVKEHPGVPWRGEMEQQPINCWRLS